MQRVAKTVAGMRGRAGRRQPPVRNEGYLTTAQCREMDRHLKGEFEAKRGITRTPYKRFSFHNPTPKPNVMPATTAPVSAPAAAAPSLVDIIAYLEKEEAQSERTVGQHIFHLLANTDRDHCWSDIRQFSLELSGRRSAFRDTISFLKRAQPQ